MSHTAEIIAVGTELLLGNIANTNAQVLSQSLSGLGVNVFWHTVVGDNPERLAQAVSVARRRADILITTGGLVPVGNPDKIKQAFAVSFGIYDMTGLDALKKGVYESIHGGYDTTAASADPHRLVPLDALLDCKKEGKIGDIYKFFGATCGVGTNIGSSQEMGKKWANMLKDAKVDACLLTST